MRFLIWLLIMALPMAAMVFGCAPLEQMFQKLEAINPNRIPVLPDSEQNWQPAPDSSLPDTPSPSFDSSGGGITVNTTADSATSTGTRRLSMKLRTEEDNDAPPPCFVYQEPGTTKSEVICTRLPWLDMGQ